MKTTPGQIDILNCGEGHAEVHVDNSDPINLARSARIIGDMLRRGYALFIAGQDGALIRVEKFDAEKNVYIIGDGPLYAGETPEVEPESPNPNRPKRAYKTKGSRAVPVEKVHTTAVPRTAGG